MDRRRRRGRWLCLAVPCDGRGGFFALCHKRVQRMQSSITPKKEKPPPPAKRSDKASLLTFVSLCNAPLISVGLLLLFFFYPLKLQLLFQDCLFATLLLKEELKCLCALAISNR